MLSTSRPSVGLEELQRLKQVLESGWLGQGEVVREFEERLQAWLGARHVVAVSSGTAALHLALDALGIGEGHEVIVPSLTFCGGVQAITATGAAPVFCEVVEATLNLDLDDVRRRLTPRTRAIMPVHFCGNACDMDALLNLGSDHNVAIVEDAAHAFGSSYRGRKLGSFGDLTCFSFDPIKNITCGEGGAVALADDARAELIRRKRVVGIDRDGWRRHAGRQSWNYEVTTQGYRYHMSNLNAAIGLAQLGKMEEFRGRKLQLVRRYEQAFADIPLIKPLTWDSAEAFPFAYMFRILGSRRDELLTLLQARGIGAGVHYPPNHLQPLFHAFAAPLPVTEKLAGELLTLPLYVGLTDEQVAGIIATVRNFFGEAAGDA